MIEHMIFSEIFPRLQKKKTKKHVFFIPEKQPVVWSLSLDESTWTRSLTNRKILSDLKQTTKKYNLQLRPLSNLAKMKLRKF